MIKIDSCYFDDTMVHIHHRQIRTEMNLQAPVQRFRSILLHLPGFRTKWDTRINLRCKYTTLLCALVSFLKYSSIKFKRFIASVVAEFWCDPNVKVNFHVCWAQDGLHSIELWSFTPLAHTNHCWTWFQTFIV